MVAGVALAYLLGYRERQREKLSHRFLGLACGAVTVLVLIWAVSSSLFYMLLR